MKAHVTELQDLFQMTTHGVAICTLVFDGSRLEDLVYDLVNPAFHHLTGLPDVTDKKLSEILPNFKVENPEVFAAYERVALTGTPESFESYIVALNCWLSIVAVRSQTGRLIVIFDNITALKAAEKEMIVWHLWLRW
jgi:PAS domain-containing protein